MEIMKNFSTSVNKNKITSIAIGGFDGMHIAHQKLFSKLDTNGAIIVIESGYANLTPKQYRDEYSNYPIFYYKLNEIKHLSGKDFIENLINQFPSLKSIVVGFDFHFGKQRQCDISDLKQIFPYEVIIIDEIKYETIPVHSKKIRFLIENGEINLANKLLGKDYKIYGKQIKGQGLGSKSFVPTINLEVKDFLLPNEGVYVTSTLIKNKIYNSVTFLGHRVTTDGSYAVETHILDKSIENKEKNIAIKFHKKLRNNEKFDSFDALKRQIDLDIENSKKYFV